MKTSWFSQPNIRQRGLSENFFSSRFSKNSFSSSNKTYDFAWVFAGFPLPKNLPKKGSFFHGQFGLFLQYFVTFCLCSRFTDHQTEDILRSFR
jgi:hypothetical protein